MSTQSTFRTTQSQHRAIQINKEATQNDAGLHRIYKEHLQDYTESTQSDTDLHRVNTKQFQSTQKLHRTFSGLHRVYIEL